MANTHTERPVDYRVLQHTSVESIHIEAIEKLSILKDMLAEELLQGNSDATLVKEIHSILEATLRSVGESNIGNIINLQIKNSLIIIEFSNGEKRSIDALSYSQSLTIGSIFENKEFSFSWKELKTTFIKEKIFDYYFLAHSILKSKRGDVSQIPEKADSILAQIDIEKMASITFSRGILVVDYIGGEQKKISLLAGIVSSEREELIHQVLEEQFFGGSLVVQYALGVTSTLLAGRTLREVRYSIQKVKIQLGNGEFQEVTFEKGVTARTSGELRGQVIKAIKTKTGLIYDAITRKFYLPEKTPIEAGVSEIIKRLGASYEKLKGMSQKYGIPLPGEAEFKQQISKLSEFFRGKSLTVEEFIAQKEIISKWLNPTIVHYFFLGVFFQHFHKNPQNVISLLHGLSLWGLFEGGSRTIGRKLPGPGAKIRGPLAGGTIALLTGVLAGDALNLKKATWREIYNQEDWFEKHLGIEGNTYVGHIVTMGFFEDIFDLFNVDIGIGALGIYLTRTSIDIDSDLKEYLSSGALRDVNHRNKRVLEYSKYLSNQTSSLVREFVKEKEKLKKGISAEEIKSFRKEIAQIMTTNNIDSEINNLSAFIEEFKASAKYDKDVEKKVSKIISGYEEIKIILDKLKSCNDNEYLERLFRLKYLIWEISSLYLPEIMRQSDFPDSLLEKFRGIQSKLLPLNNTLITFIGKKIYENKTVSAYHGLWLLQQRFEANLKSSFNVSEEQSFGPPQIKDTLYQAILSLSKENNFTLDESSIKFLVENYSQMLLVDDFYIQDKEKDIAFREALIKAYLGEEISSTYGLESEKQLFDIIVSQQNPLKEILMSANEKEKIFLKKIYERTLDHSLLVENKEEDAIFKKIIDGPYGNQFVSFLELIVKFKRDKETFMALKEKRPVIQWSTIGYTSK